MSWSLGEIRALATKAAKGAGFSWGEAEEAGFAVEWLEARCAPGVEAFAHYLSATHNAATCPIRTGCTMADMGEWESVFPKTVYQPLLLAPFMAGALGRETIALQAKASEILISQMDAYVEDYDASNFNSATQISVSAKGTIPDNSTCKSRVSSDQKPFVEILTKFAHKTYAPATEASRLAGAGAGTTDND